jgi:hypothetical protein
MLPKPEVDHDQAWLLHYRFVSSRLRLSAVTDRKIQKQTALVQALKDRAIKEMRRLKLLLASREGCNMRKRASARLFSQFIVVSQDTHNNEKKDDNQNRESLR